MISRRVFCILTGAAVAVPQRGFASKLDQPRGWLDCIQNLEAAARIGARLRPEIADGAASLCIASSKRLDRCAEGASPELLGRIIADEFRNGEIVVLAGVAFSRAEVVLYERAYRAMSGV